MDRNFGVSAEEVGFEQGISDILLTHVDNLHVRPGGVDSFNVDLFGGRVLETDDEFGHSS
jgi:hypothetical protein